MQSGDKLFKNPFGVINLARTVIFLMYSKRGFVTEQARFGAWGSLEANFITGPDLQSNGAGGEEGLGKV